MQLFRWEAPGPYAVAFSTRLGGVSAGDFASLNLGLLTEDAPENVTENRRRLAAEVEADDLVLNLQQHGTRVRRAVPTTAPEPADGLYADAPGPAMLVLAADCAPVALARADRPALALLHAGWRGLLGGILAEGAAALGGGDLHACIGPAIGPCCYEVGPEVAEPFRAAYGDDVVRDGRLDLPEAAERALRAAGVETVERVDLCTACHPELFFSHRRDRGRTGRQGAVGRVVSAGS